MARITLPYVAILEEMPERDPQAIFFAGGTGAIAMVVERRATSPTSARIILHGEVIDGHLVSEGIDIVLDTFPFPGGNACLAAQAHGAWRAGGVDAAGAEQRDAIRVHVARRAPEGREGAPLVAMSQRALSLAPPVA